MAMSNEILVLEKPQTPLSSPEGRGALNDTIQIDPGQLSIQQPSNLTLSLIIGSVMVAIFLTTVDQTIVGTAIPKITDEFHGLAQVSWYGAAYFLTLGTFRPFWGKFCKFFPLKPTFIFTIGLFELGSLLCGVAPNSTAFIIGRAITGVGGAGLATAGTTIVALSAPPKQRPMFMGFLGVGAALGNITGPLLGGVFSDRATWRWCFYVNLPIGGVVIGLILIFLRGEMGVKASKANWKQVILHMDVPGIALILSGMVCFTLALQYGGAAYPWKSSQVIGLLVGFVLIETTLGVWEFHQGEYAMLPWRLMKQRPLWATCLFQFFFAGSFFLILYYLPIYFQSILGVSSLQSGVYNLPLVIVFGISILLGGIAVAKTGHATPFMVVGAVLTCVSAGLFFSMGTHTPPAKWIGYQILAGAAIAFPFFNCLSLAQAYVDDVDISLMSSIVQFSQTLGGSFSISAAQSAFINRLFAALANTDSEVDPMRVTETGAAELRTVFSASELPDVIRAYNQGIKAAFAVSIGMAGVAVIMCLLCPWSKLPTHGKREDDTKLDGA